jgi:glycosyltransferase involved in cell wall biosynthesis
VEPGEIVRHELDGVLVPAEDVAALADAVRRLTADQDLRRRLGNAARTGGRRFAAEPIMALWNELIVDAMRAAAEPLGSGDSSSYRRRACPPK